MRPRFAMAVGHGIIIAGGLVLCVVGYVFAVYGPHWWWSAIGIPVFGAGLWVAVTGVMVHLDSQS